MLKRVMMGAAALALTFVGAAADEQNGALPAGNAAGLKQAMAVPGGYVAPALLGASVVGFVAYAVSQGGSGTVGGCVGLDGCTATTTTNATTTTTTPTTTTTTKPSTTTTTKPTTTTTTATTTTTTTATKTR